MPVTSYSTTASSNNSAAPNGAPEGMTPGSVNDTIRQIMADIAYEAQVNDVTSLNSISGTDTITADMDPELAAYVTGMRVVFTPAGTNTGAATLNIDGLGAKAIVKHNNVALSAGDLKAAVPANCIYDGTSFVLQNPLLANSANTDPAEPGYKGIPFNDQTLDYTCVLSDAGKAINQTGSNKTITIPANASVAYPKGTVLTFVNGSATNMSIAITSDTLALAGTGGATTGTRTLSSGSIATALKVATTFWYISGTGLS